MSQTAILNSAAPDACPQSPVKGRLFTAYITGSAWLSAGFAAIIFTALAIQSAPGILSAGGTFLSATWLPSQGQYGMVPMIFGSVIVMVIAMAVALPVGVFAAMAISQIRSPKLRRAVKALLEALAGIPSIVYGLIGVSFLSVFVADIFDLQTGRVILTAGLLLSVMILPTILTLTEDAISDVPKAIRQNAAALGLYRYEIFKDAVLPVAGPHIAGAALLALGRALGETMAVMLVIGSLDRLPDPLYNVLSSGQTITSKLGREVGESAFGSVHFSALIFASLILVTITLSLTIASQIIFSRRAKSIGMRHV